MAWGLGLEPRFSDSKLDFSLNSKEQDGNWNWFYWVLLSRIYVVLRRVPWGCGNIRGNKKQRDLVSHSRTCNVDFKRKPNSWNPRTTFRFLICVPLKSLAFSTSYPALFPGCFHALETNGMDQ